MKKLIIIILLNKTVSAQVELKQNSKFYKLGEVTQMGAYIADLKYTTGKKDTTYVLGFVNQEYKTIIKTESVSFSGQSKLNQFYNILMSVFSEENRKDEKYSMNFILGETNMYVANSRTMAAPFAYISTEHSHFTLNEKQVKKLFNKDK